MNDKTTEQLQAEWLSRVNEIAEKYDMRNARIFYTFEVACAAMVLEHRLEPSNVRAWIEGRLEHFEQYAKTFGTPQEALKPKRKRRAK